MTMSMPFMTSLSVSFVIPVMMPKTRFAAADIRRGVAFIRPVTSAMIIETAASPIVSDRAGSDIDSANLTTISIPAAINTSIFSITPSARANIKSAPDEMRAGALSSNVSTNIGTIVDENEVITCDMPLSAV